MKSSNIIFSSLSAKIDYSREFSERVRNIGKDIEALIGIRLKHVEGMDYAAGQYLSINLDGAIDYPSRKNYSIEIRIYISSKAPLFYFYIIDKSGNIKNKNSTSHPIEVNRLPKSTQMIVDKARDYLISKSYTEADYESNFTIAPDCLTQLDALPASIFDVLFAEII